MAEHPAFCDLSAMKNLTLIKTTSCAACLGAVAMMGFAGCATSGDPINTLLGLVGNVGLGGRSAVQSDYLYYPEYDIYYNRNTREFLSVENNRWVVRDYPRHVSPDRIFATRAIRLDGYDSPEHHRNTYYQQNRNQSRRHRSDSSRGWNSSDGNRYRSGY